MVQQHIGMHLGQVARGKRAGGLVFAGVHVDPAGVPGLAQLVQIVLAHGPEALQNQVIGLLVGHVHPEVADHGAVQVVHVHFVQPKHLLAQGKVVVQDGQAFVNHGDQVVIHGLGDFEGLHGRGQGGGIVSRGSKEGVLLYAGGIGAGNGCAIFAVGAHDALKGLAAHIPVVGMNEGGIIALGQLLAGAVGQGDGGKLHIHAGEHGEGIVRGMGQFAHHGQQPLLLLGQGVGLLPQELAQVFGVVAHVRIVHHVGEGLLVHGQQLRLQEGAGGGQLHHGSHDAVLLGLGGGVGVVGLLLEHGIHVNGGNLFVQDEILPDHLPGVLGYMPVMGGKGLHLLRQGGKSLLPCLVGGENIGQLPLVLVIDFTALAQLFSHMAILLSSTRGGGVVSIVAYMPGKSNPCGQPTAASHKGCCGSPWRPRCRWGKRRCALPPAQWCPWSPAAAFAAEAAPPACPSARARRPG